ncbi:hypothetical protein [Agromyces albus]|uniref:hypothetical protein n=1 Tax=Agromyces albus TaxID=205332 RepID=UPI00277FB168|nr:hypothetical protein [Agromyces albus]MDQ0575063.1 hypothetical protein [Agromyces albus]
MSEVRQRQVLAIVLLAGVALVIVASILYNVLDLREPWVIAVLAVGGPLWVVLGVSIDVSSHRQAAKAARIRRGLRTDFPHLD